MTKKVGIFDVSIKTDILKTKEAAPKGMAAKNALSMISTQMNSEVTKIV